VFALKVSTAHWPWNNNTLSVWNTAGNRCERAKMQDRTTQHA